MYFSRYAAHILEHKPRDKLNEHNGVEDDSAVFFNDVVHCVPQMNLCMNCKHSQSPNWSVWKANSENGGKSIV